MISTHLPNYIESQEFVPKVFDNYTPHQLFGSLGTVSKVDTTQLTTIGAVTYEIRGNYTVVANYKPHQVHRKLRAFPKVFDNCTSQQLHGRLRTV